MAVTQLGYIGLDVSDLDTWCRYATEVLGLELSGRDQHNAYLRMDELHHRIILHQGSRDDLAYAGWQAPDAEAFAETLRRLDSADIPYQRGTEDETAQRMVRALVRFELSGVPMEVCYGPRALFEQPFRSPIGLQGFRTGDLGMGHIAFAGDNPKELARLMIEGLGFEVGDSFSGFECLLRCNRRENTVFIPAAPFEGGKRLNHFMIEALAFDDVGSCVDRCEDNGIEVTSRLGRHTNDLSVSFYMRTPAGFRVEYGWDSKTVDNTGDWPVRDYDRSSVWGHSRR